MDEQNNQAEEEVVEKRPSHRRHNHVERRYRFASKKRKQRQFPKIRWWRHVLLAVLLLTAVLFIINPFPRWAQAQAKIAQPPQPLAVTLPAAAENGYCIVGKFQDWDSTNTPLLDDGTEGDRVPGDGIYSRTITFEETGRYTWRIIPCGERKTAVPEKPAWVFATSPNQPITITFNPTMPEGNLWPRSYAISANDTLPARLVVVGSFQKERWSSEDASTVLEPAGKGQWQLVYRVPLPGTYETYVAIQGRNEGIGASGRSVKPIPLTFSTQQNGEMVVIQYDGQTDRIAVLYSIPGWLRWLGYGLDSRIIAAIALLGAFILGAQIAYRSIVLHPSRQFKAGCPNCQQHDLQRIKRKTADYLLDMVGVPVRRYKCPHCGWQGRRIYRRRR